MPMADILCTPDDVAGIELRDFCDCFTPVDACREFTVTVVEVNSRFAAAAAAAAAATAIRNTVLASVDAMSALRVFA